MTLVIKVLSPFPQASPDFKYARVETGNRNWGSAGVYHSHPRPNKEMLRRSTSPCWEHSLRWTSAIDLTYLFRFSLALGKYVCC